MPELGHRTLADLVCHLRKAFGHRERFFTVRRGGRLEAFTGAELIDRAWALAVALEAGGAAKGDRVAILAENRPEWHVVDFACQLSGLVSVPIYPNLPPDQVSYIVNDSGARWVFFSDADKKAALEDLIRWSSSPPAMVAMEVEARLERGTTLDELVRRGEPLRQSQPLEDLARRVGPEDLASILYTSGTTGSPKGVMLTHENLASNAVAASKVYPGPGGEAEQNVCFLPLCHVFARTTANAFLNLGIAIHYVAKIEEVPEALKEMRPTVVASVPLLFETGYQRIQAMVEQMTPARRRIFRWGVEVGERYTDARLAGGVGAALRLQHSLAERLVHRKIQERFGGRLSLVVAGGAALPGPVEIFFHAVGVSLFQGYGLTETSPMVTINYPDHHRMGSVGVAAPGVSIRTSADGEVEVKGPCVMRGYWNKPEATREVLGDDGWLKTGDLGSIDADGYLFITGRKKDLLVLSEGTNVAPVPIEHLLTAAPSIGQALVVGDGRPYLCALIVPDFDRLGIHTTPERLLQDPRLHREIGEVVETVNRLLPQHERLRHFHLVAQKFTVEGGELTPTLKVRRPIVVQRYRAEIDAMYALDAADSPTV